MKLIILAAGRGRRLGHLTDHLPKPLIPITHGKTILDYTLMNAIQSKCFNSVVVITGYKESLVRQLLRKYESDILIETCHNARYMDTGPLYSLWVAREKLMDNDFVIVNGDTLYDITVFDLLKHKSGVFNLFVSVKNDFDIDDVKVQMKDTLIAKVGKKVPPSLAGGVSAGVFSVKGRENRRIVYDTLHHMHEYKQFKNKIWHDIVNYIIDQRCDVFSIHIDDDAWNEIDTEKEYNLLIANNEIREFY